MNDVGPIHDDKYRLINDVGLIHIDKYKLIGNQWYIFQLEKIVVTFEQLTV